MNVFPNPADDVLQMSATDMQAGIMQLTIFNALGQIVLTEKIISAGSRIEKRIDVSSLNKGIYTIQLKGDQVDLRRKVEIR